MGRGKILIIEDNASMRYVLRRTLETAGYTVHTASDSSYGLRHLHEHKEEHCLILLDLLTPQVDGWQLLARCSSDPVLRQFPVVVLTGALSPGEKLIGIQPAAILHKPVSDEVLLATVAEHLPDS